MERDPEAIRILLGSRSVVMERDAPDEPSLLGVAKDADGVTRSSISGCIYAGGRMIRSTQTWRLTRRVADDMFWVGQKDLFSSIGVPYLWEV